MVWGVIWLEGLHLSVVPGDSLGDGKIGATVQDTCLRVALQARPRQTLPHPQSQLSSVCQSSQTVKPFPNPP